MNPAPLAGIERADILLQGTQRPGIVLHEVHELRASRERLESQRASAGEQVEHARARQVVLEDAHPRLPHALRRRPHRRSFRRRDASPFPLPRDDPHRAVRKSASPSCRLVLPRYSSLSSLYPMSSIAPSPSSPARSAIPHPTASSLRSPASTTSFTPSVPIRRAREDT